MSTQPDENSNINCIDCIDCTNCTDCTNCINSNNLDHCTNCSNCNFLVDCNNCISCTNLIYIDSANDIHNQIGNIYTVNENYFNTDTININPLFSFTTNNVLFTNITPNTLSVNETTGNISGVISQLPSVTLTFNNQNFVYTFNTNIHRIYDVQICNNYVVYT